MFQTLDRLPETAADPILCSYTNRTGTLQVARITNVPGWYFERVVFPGQHLLFEAYPQGILEIHTGALASAILTDQIPCFALDTDPNLTPLVQSQVVVTA